MTNELDIAVTSFSSVLEMKIQQTRSFLRGRVAEGAHRGKQASPVQYLAPVKMGTPQAKYSPIVHQANSFSRRWVFPKDGSCAQIVDTFDELRLISDPKSMYSTNTAAAVGREWDDRIIAKALGTATTGTDVDALGSETFDTTTYGVASTYGTSGGATGLTVAKLIELRRKFDHYGQDGMPDDQQITLVIGSQQHADLLAQTQVVSTDYVERPVLQEGRITRYMGFDFQVSERLLTETTNVRSCLAFMKSGMYLGVWSEVENSVDKLVHIESQPWQLYTKMTSGSVRLQPGKLIAVYCSDSVGASIVP